MPLGVWARLLSPHPTQWIHSQGFWMLPSADHYGPAQTHTASSLLDKCPDGHRHPSHTFAKCLSMYPVLLVLSALVNSTTPAPGSSSPFSPTTLPLKFISHPVPLMLLLISSQICPLPSSSVPARLPAVEFGCFMIILYPSSSSSQAPLMALQV